MSKPSVTTVHALRSKRDLRAEFVDLATVAQSRKRRVALHVIAPRMNPDSVRAEWQRMLAVLSEEVRGRLSLIVDDQLPLSGASFPLPRPNYRYEVLRLLIDAKLGESGLLSGARSARRRSKTLATLTQTSGAGRTAQQLAEQISVSVTPIRSALGELEKAGVAINRGHGRGSELDSESLSLEMLARVGALPQMLRFRFERGAQIKTPVALLKRVLPLLHPDAPSGWEAFALSGVAAAHNQVAKIDLVGLPRLDLVAKIDREASGFDLDVLRLLDAGLELEPNVLAPAPVVVALVRANAASFRAFKGSSTRYAAAADVLLALLDMGLREQAMHYARAPRP